MSEISQELAQRMAALASRSGAVGPHTKDRINATVGQLAEWAETAAKNIDEGWRNAGIFSGCLGGWEQAFLRQVAEEFRAIAALLPVPVDPDRTEAAKMLSEDIFGTPDGHDMLFGRVEARWEDYLFRGIKRGRELQKEGK